MITELTFTSKKKTVNVMDDPDVYLISITGLSPEGVINTSSINGYDGSTVVSTQVPERKIEMVLGFKGDDAEATKEQLYLLFAPKSTGTMLYKSSLKKRKINYLSATPEIVLTEYPMRAQISLVCPDPYFKDLSDSNEILAQSLPKFMVPFTITKKGLIVGSDDVLIPNDSDDYTFYFSKTDPRKIIDIENKSGVDVGLYCVFNASASLVDPYIMNVETYEKMQLLFSLNGGEKAAISTLPTDTNNKKLILRDGKEINIPWGKSIWLFTPAQYNISNYKKITATQRFTFMKLHPGINRIKYGAESGESNLEVEIFFSNQYGGV